MSNANVVEKYLTALNNQDLDSIAALYAQDATVEDPVGTPLHTGIEAIREFYTKATSIKLTAELLGDVRCAGEFVAFPFSITLPSEHGPMCIEVIDTFKLNSEGKITEMKAYWNEQNTKLVK